MQISLIKTFSFPVISWKLWKVIGKHTSLHISIGIRTYANVYVYVHVCVHLRKLQALNHESISEEILCSRIWILSLSPAILLSSSPPSVLPIYTSTPSLPPPFLLLIPSCFHPPPSLPRSTPRSPRRNRTPQYIPNGISVDVVTCPWSIIFGVLFK